MKKGMGNGLLSVQAMKEYLSASGKSLVPVLTAAVAAAGTTALIHPLLRGHDTYTDFVAGAPALQGWDKSYDFRTAMVFFLLVLFFALAVNALINHAKRLPNGRQSASALHSLLGYVLVPAFFWLGATFSGARCSFDLVILSLLGILLVTASSFAMFLRHPDSLTARLILDIAGASITLPALGAFGGLAAATVMGRVILPLLQSTVDMTSQLVLAGLLLSGLIALLLMLFSRQPESARRGFLAAIVLFQVPLPLLFFVLIPPLQGSGQGVFSGLTISGTLWFVVALLVVASYIQLIFRARSFRLRAEGIEGLLAPLVIAAPAVFMIIYFQAPSVVGDDYHIAEKIVPLQQLLHFGKLPFVDLNTPHGFVDLFAGFFSSIFLDGTLGSLYVADSSYIAGISLLVIFAAFCTVTNPFVAFFLAVATSLAFSLRYTNLILGMIVFANPRLLSKADLWLLLWVVFTPLSFLYAFSTGIAFGLGSLPVAVWMIRKQAREGASELAKVAVALCVMVALSIVTPIGRITIAAVQYIADVARFNAVAAGISFWDAQAGVDLSGPKSFSNYVISDLFRFLWVGVTVFLAWGSWVELKRPVGSRRIDVLWVSSVSVISAFVLLPYIIGRIEPGSPSRTGIFTLVSIFNFLPLFLIVRQEQNRLWHILLMLAVLFGFHMGQVRQFIGAQKNLSTIDEFPFIGFDALIKKPFASVPLPKEQPLVDGTKIGLPNLGRVAMDSERVKYIVELKEILGRMLKPGETYLDLTNRAANYFYLGYEVPVAESAYFNSPTRYVQNKVLKQIVKTPPPVVLVDGDNILIDGLPLSLRWNIVYRHLVLNYIPAKIGRFTFLVEPARAARLKTELAADDHRLVLLDKAFRIQDIKKIPASWGKSLDALEPRLKERGAVSPDRLISLHDFNANKDGSFSPSGADSFMVYDVTGLGLDGRNVRFAAFKFTCEQIQLGVDPVLGIYWKTASSDFSEEDKILLTGENGMLLIPLDSAPRWLLGRSISALRLDLQNPDVCRSIRVDAIRLLSEKSEP